MMRKILIVAMKTLFVILVLAGLFSGWLLWVDRWYRSIEPGRETLSEHLAKGPPSTQQRVMVADGREYLLLFGPHLSLPAFPSGYPVYVFDDAGKLVDWTSDEGDDEKFKRRWPGLFHCRQVTADEVTAWPGAK